LDDNKINKEVVEEVLNALSKNERDEELKKLGLRPSLPFVLESIDDDVAYDIKDIADLLGYTQQHLTRLCRQGKIHSIQISGKKGRHRIFGEELKKFILKKINYSDIIRSIL